MAKQQHEIKTDDLRTSLWIDQPERALVDGEIRLSIDAFALTANNVTYAAFGNAPMHYWNFFPARQDGYGRVPVWGFATVKESRHQGIPVGKRVYGYLPIAHDLVVQPARVTERGFMDGAAHRQGLAPIYNTYSYTDQDPAYIAEYEAEQMLFRPLYLTGWMICDCLAEGAQVPDIALVSSASSKTALATAHGLKHRGIRAIGITSARNKTFVTETGLYDEVVTYDEVGDLSLPGKIAYVDFVGRPDLTKTLHDRAGAQMVRSLIIGVTDWEGERTPLGELPGAQPEFFFVPDYAAARAKALPAGELDRTMGRDLVAFYPISSRLVKPTPVSGATAIRQAWRDTVDAKIAPDQGLVCTF